MAKHKLECAIRNVPYTTYAIKFSLDDSSNGAFLDKFAVHDWNICEKTEEIADTEFYIRILKSIYVDIDQAIKGVCRISTARRQTLVLKECHQARLNGIP